MPNSVEHLFAPLSGVPLDDLALYAVGGAVRDHLLGVRPHDVDYVLVGSDAKTLLSRGFRQVGADFPVFLHPHSQVEVALARTERKTAPGHQGFVVHADPGVTLNEDLQRRDFTINAMAIDRRGQLIDPYGGQRDLEARRLHHVSCAFREDPLRILRGIRFLATLAPFGFRLDPETQALMTAMRADLLTLSVERVTAEIMRTLEVPQALAGLSMLTPLGALDTLAPELARLPTAFFTTDPLSRLVEWCFANAPSTACITSTCARFKTSAHSQRVLIAALQLARVDTLDAARCLSTMQQIGWLRGNAPDPALDQQLLNLDQAQLFPIPASTWIRWRDAVRRVTAASEGFAALTGKALGEAIHEARLKVLSTEISAPGTAPGL